MAGRGQWTPEKVRARIRVGMIVTRLQKHVAGEIELSQTQVAAANVLLKKVLPDQTEVIGEIKHLHAITSKPLNSVEFQQQLEASAYSLEPPERPAALSN